MPKPLSLFVVAALAAVTIAAGGAAWLGGRLTAPAPAAPPALPPALGARPLAVATPEGTVRGWTLPGRPGGGVVLLLHPLRASRAQMLPRARLLQQAGYTAVLVDLPAHGESDGSRIGFGLLESRALRPVWAALQQAHAGERFAVVGVSLGAASFVFAGLEPAPAAAVLESMYPTVREAAADRLELRLGPAGRWLAGPLLWQLPLRLGIDESQLRPIDRLPALRVPLAIAAGDADRHTRWDETQRLFDAAPAPKRLWRFEGAAHEDLYAFAPADYEARLLGFLGLHLRGATPAATP